MKEFFLMVVCVVAESLLALVLIPEPTQWTIDEDKPRVVINQLPSLQTRMVKDATLGKEGYRLSLTRHAVVCEAATPAGLFYAQQTWRQLVAQIDATGALPQMAIVDVPKIETRLLMIDSGRQYQRVATLKRLLDLMSQLKMNTLHWHLTEVYGWRIPITAYPKLTTVGAFVGQGKEQHGAYTRDEIKELVAYAAARHIQIIPEIDFPGHAEAALTAYPEWSCLGKPPVRGKHFSSTIFCAGKPQAVTAMKVILTEVANLFPAPYIHIGGDEAPKQTWRRCPDCQARMQQEQIPSEHDLQVALTNELAAHLKTLNKRAIVWNDCYSVKNRVALNKSIVIDYWNHRSDRGEARLRAIEASGHDWIFSPNTYCYLNFPETPWQGYYRDRTLPHAKQHRHLQNPFLTSDLPRTYGVALWTDYELTESMLDARLFPRLYGHAHVMWRGTGMSVDFETWQRQINTIDPLFKRLSGCAAGM